MAIFSLLECFATFHELPILERSIAVRRTCFFIYFAQACIIILFVLHLGNGLFVNFLTRPDVVDGLNVPRKARRALRRTFCPE